MTMRNKLIQQSALIAGVAICSCLALAAGYWFGTQRQDQAHEGLAALQPLLAASAATSDTMAVATGPISDNAEGIFFLDFLTGDLQCMVYYPRYGRIGAHYYTNVAAQLGRAGGKNSQYLMVTGQAIQPSTSGQIRSAASLVYVTDVVNGTFAGYAIPWDRTSESAGRPQSGPLVLAAAGRVRNFQLPDPAQNPPAAVVDPDNK